MNTLFDQNTLQVSLLGALRGMVVHTALYPIEVVKIRQQINPQPEKAYCIAKRMFQEEGLWTFYRGITPQLVKTSCKQAWSWPMIIGIPPYLERLGVPIYGQEVITGVSISLVDTVLTTPFERWKMEAIVKKGKPLRIPYRPWQGWKTHCSKLILGWCTFLVAQRYFRDSQRNKQEPLSLSQMVVIGFKVAVVVGIISAPYDFLTTRALSQVIERNSLRSLFRGMPLNTLKLSVHNIASVALIEKLSNR